MADNIPPESRVYANKAALPNVPYYASACSCADCDLVRERLISAIAQAPADGLRAGIARAEAARQAEGAKLVAELAGEREKIAYRQGVADAADRIIAELAPKDE